MDQYRSEKSGEISPSQPLYGGDGHVYPANGAGTAPPARLNLLRRPIGAVLSGSRPAVPASIVNILVALYLVCGINIPFWKAFYERLGLDSAGHWAFFILTGVAMWMAFNIILSPFSWKPIHKPLILLVLVISSTCSYFMQSYGIIIDNHMIINIMETDSREASELITWSMFSHLLLLGGLPALLLMFVRITYKPWKRELLARGGMMLGSGILLFALILAGFKQVTLFGRQNRDLRMYVIPTYPIYSAIKAAKKHGKGNQAEPVRVIAADAAKPAHAKRAVILVVGETARSINFSLNGYERDTNPGLKNREVFSFTDVQSCGTNTAESVPCMFSHLERENYSRSEAGKYENVLDVLQRAGVQVLWRDNNSGSKGVADRVIFQDLANAADRTLCSTEECYDEILLKDLDTVLQQNTGDILVVLHQKGSHGPAYYKRFPEKFARFLPQCTQDNVQDCDPTSIVNAYDNTILYTDALLSQVIDILKEQQYATAMLYVSDHGESLGEKNIYLHGLPYAIAPKEQKHVPMIFWGSDMFLREKGIERQSLTAGLHAPLSHDYLFHSLLGLFQVATEAYRPELDIFHRTVTPSGTVRE